MNAIVRHILIVACLLTPFLESRGEERGDSVLVIGRDVRSIADYQFKDRTDIYEVRFEEGSRLESIGEYAFLGCSNLRAVNLPSSLKTLGEGCFRECVTLESLEIPEKVTALPKSMCVWNSGLTRVILPKGLKDIGSHAFAYCESLTHIEIPSGVTHIGSNAFSRCLSLESIVLPAGMKELESYTFSDCISLREAVMPSNSNLLGELIFSGCDSLVILEVGSRIPPRFDCDSFPFDPSDRNAYNRCRLYVPERSVPLYHSAPGWSLFLTILTIRR